MTAPTSFTAEQIAQFEQSLIDRNGVMFATFGDQQVSFTSYADAMTFLAEMRRAVAAAQGGTAGGSVTRYASMRKGA